MLVPIQQYSVPTILGQSYNALTVASLGGDTLSQQRYSYALGSLEVAFGDGFTIVADLLDADIASVTAGTPGPQVINAQLFINSIEFEIVSFQYQRPTGKIGGVLNAVLATTDIDDVPDFQGSVVELKLIILTPGGTKTWSPMVDGKLVGVNNVEKFVSGDIQSPHDEITISVIEKINDILEIAPRIPVVVYDPFKTKVELPTSHEEGNYIVDVSGRDIVPILEPIGGLNLYYALQRAYSIGLGLGIVTNLPNYSISRLNFSIEGSWHSGVAGFISIFDPLIFSNSNVLYVMDSDQYLPAGFNPKIITADDHYALGDSHPFNPSRNALLVTYEYKSSDPFNESGGTIVENTFTDSTVDESGGPFDRDYTKSLTDVTYVEVTNSNDPDTILSSFETYRAVTTIANVVDEETSNLSQKEIHHEETCLYYDEDLPVGFGKTVWGLWLAGSQTPVTVTTKNTVPTRTPGVFEFETVEIQPSPALIRVSTDDNSVFWIDDSLNPGSVIQAYSVTRTEGLVYKDSEAETVINPITGQEQEIFRKYPLLAAQASNKIDNDADSADTITWEPITTTIEELIRVRKNQSKVAVRVIDHLNNTIKTSFTSGKVFSRDAISNNSGDDGVKTKTVLLRDLTSESSIGPRPPESLSTTGLSRQEAITLGSRILARFQNPPIIRSIELTGVEFSARQGSVFNVQDRDGNTNGVYVTGLSINGINLGTDGHHIGMILDTIRLLTR